MVNDVEAKQMGSVAGSRRLDSVQVADCVRLSRASSRAQMGSFEIVMQQDKSKYRLKPKAGSKWVWNKSVDGVAQVGLAPARNDQNAKSETRLPPLLVDTSLSTLRSQAAVDICLLVLVYYSSMRTESMALI